MSADDDQTADVIRIGSSPAATPPREAMWEVISASWDAQSVRRRQKRVVRSRLVAGFGIAATLTLAVLAGRWSVQIEPSVAPPSAAIGQPAVSLPRQVALDAHLRDAETLLVLFETDAERNAGFAERARDLAAASRMLMTYSAGQDTELESLLQDLELLLLQIAHVAVGSDTTELEITVAGIRDAAAIPRMRLLRSQDSRLDEI